MLHVPKVAQLQIDVYLRNGEKASLVSGDLQLESSRYST